MPESELRVIAPDVGGGFGQKMSLAPEFVLVTWLARKSRTSVAWTEDRRENLVACFHSRDQYVSLEGAFDADAKLVALSADILANVGAYSCYPTTCGVEPLMAMAEMPGPYDVREYACVSRGVADQHLPDGALSRRLAAGDHLHHRAADGQGRRRIRHRPGGDPPAQPHPHVSLYVGDGSGVRRSDLRRDHGEGGRSRSTCRRSAHARRRPATTGRYLGFGIATFSERTGYGTPAFAARGMEVTPGWETVELADGPVGLHRGAHRRLAARPGAAHHAVADHRRRTRHLARPHQRSCTAIPTARPTAGARSPAARW